MASIIIAKQKYLKDKSKFINNRIIDGATEYKNQQHLLKNRIKKKEWENIYPINNHDFNYKEYTLNKYNPYTLGISNNTSIANLVNSSMKLNKYNQAILYNPTPNMNSVSGVSDVNNSDPNVQNELEKIKQQYTNMPLPYPTFKEDYPENIYPTKGEYASSYFLKVGQCKTKDNQQNCIKKNLKWVPNKPNLQNIQSFFNLSKTKNNIKSLPKKINNGNCYKPRFIYLNNKSKGSGILKGLTPSLFDDIMNITPERLMAIISGYSVGGGGLLPCKEGYVDYNLPQYNITKYIIYFILLFVCLYISYKYIFS